MEHFRQFQELIWNSSEAKLPSPVWTILSALAYDLDFYVPDAAARAQDPSYYGDDRAEEEIRSALKKLQEIDIRP